MRNNTTFTLAKSQLVSYRLRALPLRITCVTGQLWTTIDGETTDYLIGAGQHTDFAGKGTVVIEALRASTVRVERRWNSEVLEAYRRGSRTISNVPIVVP